MNDLFIVPLKEEDYFVVDVEDADIVKGESWQRGDEHGSVRGTTGKVKGLHLTYLVNRTPQGFETDHINGNLHDYTRRNLRTATRSQNSANRGKTKRLENTSNYKGVFWDKSCVKFKAQIQVNYKRIHLGCFDNEIDAARAYNIAAKTHFGQFAKLNDLGQHTNVDGQETTQKPIVRRSRRIVFPDLET